MSTAASALPPTESMIHPAVAKAATVTVSGIPTDCEMSDTTVGGVPNAFDFGFEGIDGREACLVTPHGAADPDIAVGRNHVIEVVNTAFAVFSTSGLMAKGATRLGSLFGDVPGCGQSAENGEDLFDPKAVYDERTDHFVVGALHIRGSASGLVGSNYCMAVSATGDPMGEWYVYVFPMDRSAPEEVWLDRPDLGVGHEAIYMAGRLCDSTPINGSGCATLTTDYIQGRAWAFKLPELYAGAPAPYAEHELGVGTSVPASGMEHPIPLDLHGIRQGSWRVGNDHFFIVWDLSSGVRFGDLRLLRWADPFATSTMNSVAVLDVDSITGTTTLPAIPLAAQAGVDGPDYIEGNVPRPFSFYFRNGNAFVSENAACVDDDPDDFRSCIRWLELDLPSGSVVQSGAIVPPASPALAVGRVFPDIAATRCNEAAIGYTRSTAASFPDAYFSYREPSDPTGTLQAEHLLRSGDLSFTANLFSGENDPNGPPRPDPDGDIYRWGDYTGISTDPTGERLWYVGEYAKNVDLSNPASHWGTFIASTRQNADPEVCTGGCLPIGDCPAGCADGIDNDDDGAVDGADSGCRPNTADTSELHGCSDFLDNDGDSLIDFPIDPGCSSATDHTESSGGCGLGYELGAAGLLAFALRNRVRRKD